MPTVVTVRKAHGFALIDLIFVCGVLGILFSIAMPSLFTAKQSAASASAIGLDARDQQRQLTYRVDVRRGILRAVADPTRDEPAVEHRLVHRRRTWQRRRRDQELVCHSDVSDAVSRRAGVLQRRRAWR
mgnify:CR=1 FL=1